MATSAEPVPVRALVTAPARQGTFSAAFLTVSTVVAGILNYGYALTLTHYLRPADFAQFAGAQALVLLVGVIGSVGVPYVVAQEVRLAAATGDHERIQEAVNFAFWANALTGVVAAAIVAMLTLRFGSPTEAVVVGGTVLSLALGSTSLGVFQGRGVTTTAAAILVGEVAAKLVVGLGLVIAVHAGAVSALTGLLGGSLVLLGSSVVCWRYIGRPRRARRFRPLLVSSVQIGAVQLGVGVIAALDTYLVAATKTYDQAAAYQVATTLGKATLFVSAAVSFAKFPLLNEANAVGLRVEALRSYLLLAGAGALVVLSVPHAVLHALLPAAYLDISTWLPYTALFGFGTGLANLFTTFVQSYQQPGSRSATRQALLMLPLGGACVAAMIVSTYAAGVRGVAVSALCSAWLVALVYGAMPRERAAVRALLSAARNPGIGVVVVSVLGVSLFFTTRMASLWLADAAVFGGCALLVAFPELGWWRRRQGPVKR